MRPIKSLFLAACAAVISAHSIHLAPHGRECFFETLHKDDKMTISYQVGDREFGSSGNFEIDFWLTDPNNQVIYSRNKTSGGSAEKDIKVDGRHEYCFSNEGHHPVSKEVLFNVHGVVYVVEDPEHSDPLEKNVKNLGELLNAVKDEQEYIVAREMVHRNTAESTNSRVKWWSIFQLGVVAANGVFQVWYLKRFFEVKRVV